MEVKVINGIKHKQVSIPCPDGRNGCLVAHYKWIPLENKYNENEFSEKELKEYKKIISKLAEIRGNLFDESDFTLEDGHDITGDLVGDPYAVLIVIENKIKKLKSEVSNQPVLSDEDTCRLFIGKKIKDMYCNGFFGRNNYELKGSVITRIYEEDDFNSDDENETQIVLEVKKQNSQFNYAIFTDCWSDWKKVKELLEDWT